MPYIYRALRLQDISFLKPTMKIGHEKQNPTSQYEKRGLKGQSMAPSVKGCYLFFFSYFFKASFIRRLIASDQRAQAGLYQLLAESLV
jgi:hypothetical protein